MSGKRSYPSERTSVFLRFDRSLIMLFTLNACTALATESVNALFPLYVQSLGASVLEVGLLLSAAGVFSTVLMIPSGWMSDRFGRKPTLILSVALASFPPLLYTIASDWRQLIPWAIIYSISFAVFIPARMVYIADRTDSESQAKMYGYMNLAWPIGSLLGPLAAGILAEAKGFHYPFFFAATVSLLSLLPALMLVERRTLNPPSMAAEAGAVRNIGFSREDIYLLTLLTVYQFLVAAGIGTTYSLLPIYLSTVFNADKFHVGLFLSLIGISLFASQLLGGWASSRFGLKKMMAICLTIVPLLLIVCTFMSSYEWFTVTYVALYGVYSATWPASIAMLMNLVDRSRWGLATGIRQTGVRLGFTIGPALGGVLWETYGSKTPFYTSATLIVISILFLIQLKE